MSLNIVLFQPEIPQNTGNIARTCVVTNSPLHIIKPMGFSLDEKHIRRAGLDYWKYLNLTVYESAEEFFEQHKDAVFRFFTTKAKKTFDEIEYPDNCFLAFGKETAGLPEDLLHSNKKSCVRIPMINDARSLNLSNSVAIGVYEVLRQWDYPELECKGKLRNYNWD